MRLENIKGLIKNIAVAVKGACMGAADVIPGVSGGTIAFIMGIYDDFVGSLAAINAEAVKMLLKGQLRPSGSTSTAASSSLWSLL